MFAKSDKDHQRAMQSSLMISTILSEESYLALP
jgi:hypothetical protein